MRIACLAAFAFFAVACSSSTPGGGSSAAGTSGGTASAAAGESTGVEATGTGGLSGTAGGATAGSGGETTGGATTGGVCQTTWPPRNCLAIAICGCADGTNQEFGCIGPPTCGDACCEHGGPYVDAGVCQTTWPPRSCLAEALCTCADGTEEEFGCIGPPTCADACCSHDGPRTGLPPDDAGVTPPDGGACQVWPPLPCDEITLCHCGDGMTEEAGCAGPPTCTDACCGHEGTAPPDAGVAASDGGACQTDWPPRTCLAESICGCADGTSQQFGCIGPPTCGDACCGHGGPGSTPDAGPAFDGGPNPDAGMCVVYPPLPCDAIIDCSCNDGTTQLAACAGPPNCVEACCGHDGVKK